jgi:hypothetical protein
MFTKKTPNQINGQGQTKPTPCGSIHGVNEKIIVSIPKF